jgi:hypothetical protein
VPTCQVSAGGAWRVDGRIDTLLDQGSWPQHNAVITRKWLLHPQAPSNDQHLRLHSALLCAAYSTPGLGLPSASGSTTMLGSSIPLGASTGIGSGYGLGANGSPLAARRRQAANVAGAPAGSALAATVAIGAAMLLLLL